MTVDQIRAQVEAAKAQAMRNFERNHGKAAVAGLQEVRKGNAKALASICAAIRKGN